MIVLECNVTFTEIIVFTKGHNFKISYPQTTNIFVVYWPFVRLFNGYVSNITVMETSSFIKGGEFD